jgi:nucleotide-binding universal stress UspA family protein
MNTPPTAPVAAIHTILVAVDCGHRSRALLRSAAALARLVGGRLVLLHVFEPITFAPPHCSLHQLRECEHARLHEAEQKLAALVGEMPDDPQIQSARLIAVGGSPEHEIAAVAREVRANVIVASTHGYRGFNHLFLGSRAEQLLRRAPCPVLILPPLVEGGDEEEDVIGLCGENPDDAPPVEDEPFRVPVEF